jgi:hypothetical protein
VNPEVAQPLDQRAITVPQVFDAAASAPFLIVGG